MSNKFYKLFLLLNHCFYSQKLALIHGRLVYSKKGVILLHNNSHRHYKGYDILIM